jgi:hypothetical protein
MTRPVTKTHAMSIELKTLWLNTLANCLDLISAQGSHQPSGMIMHMVQAASDNILRFQTWTLPQGKMRRTRVSPKDNKNPKPPT